MGIKCAVTMGKGKGNRIYANKEWDSNLQKGGAYAVDVMITLTAIAKQRDVAWNILGPIRSSPLLGVSSYMDSFVERCGVLDEATCTRLVLVFDGKRLVLRVVLAIDVFVNAWVQL